MLLNIALYKKPFIIFLEGIRAMTAFFYIEANLMCILISSILVIREIRSIDKRLRNIEFIKTLSVYIAFYLLEIIWTLFKYDIIKIGLIGQLLTVFLNITTFSYGSYQWFLYSEICQGNSGIYTTRNRRKWGIPFFCALIIYIILVIVGVTQKDYAVLAHYIKILNSVMVTVAVGYEIASIIGSLSRIKQKSRNQVRFTTYLFLVISPVLFSSTIILQTIFNDIPLFCFVNTIWLISYYLNGMDDIISIDSLTKLNNRNQLRKYFHQIPNDTKYESYILVIDIDHFKAINDKFGHLEGDNALVLVSDTFRKVCSTYPHKIFLCRYGGDEFVIVAQALCLDDIKNLKNDLNNNLFITATSCSLPYKLEISVGYTKVTNDYEKLNEYIQIADKEMYLEKSNKVYNRER